MRNKLSIAMLGGAEVSKGGVPLSGSLQGKDWAILALLASGARPHSRQELSALLWPNLAREAARSNLRKSVFRLRNALGSEAVLQPSAETLALDPGGFMLDAPEFLAVTPACSASPPSPNCTACLARMERGLELYRGRFLEGLAYDSAPDFEDWLCIRRETLHRHALGLLERLTHCHEQNGAQDKALHFARHCLEMEPWNEPAHRTVMRLLAQSGQARAALSQFESCRRMLQQELGSEPDTQTIALFNQIQSSTLPAGTATSRASATQAERRQVTALYCSFRTDEPGDPDDVAEKLAECHRRISSIVRGFGGYVSQMHGGALVVYFGYPSAFEDAARRAVRAALALGELEDSGFHVRAGLHTGLIVTSADLPDAMGLTSSIAMRLKDPNHPVLLSEPTRLLVEGYFRTAPVGPRQFEEVAQPVLVYRVLGESGARHRLEAAERLAPLAGRKTELDTLLKLWGDASQGHRRIALLQGEAGIGKSRLVQALRERAQNSCIYREMRCFPEFSQSPFHPVIALLASLCEFAGSDTDEARAAKLAHFIQAHYPQADGELLPLLAQLLSLPQGDALKITPGRKKQRLGALLIDLLKMLAARQPVLFVVEDLHWADPSTLELIALFANAPPEGAILMVLTSRPEFDPPWNEEHETFMELHALAHEDAAAVVSYWSSDTSDAMLARIIERSDGIPLFVEEMAKLARNGLAEIPSTLQDLLAAKLDGAGEAKRTAQLAATVGREFDLSLLREISPVPDRLRKNVHQLLDANLILPLNENLYQFKHALIQEAAYQSQTKAARAAAHRRIAEASHDRLAVTGPEILARHWAACGETQRAIEFWIKAGNRANQQSSVQEAMAHFRAGLELAELLPAGARRDQLEFALQVGLGIALHAAQGYGSTEAHAAFSRAMELCGQAATHEMFQTIWGIWVSMLGHFPTALAFAQQLPGIARQLDDPALETHASYVLGNTLFWLGDFEAARAHSRSAIMAYRPEYSDALVEKFGADSAVTAGVFLAAAHWFAGFPEQAREASGAMLALARHTGHPHTLGFALAAAATLNRRMRLPGPALALADEALALATRHNLPLWQVMALMLRGWALAMQGEPAGVALVQRSIAAVQTSMSAISVIFLATLADVQLHLAQCQIALDATAQAVKAMEDMGDRHYEAELHRLRGEALLGLDRHGEAEISFYQALEVSRRQGAKSLELRAAMSLAHHFGQMLLLAETHAWFTEGHDTPDLVEARTLLEERRSARRYRTQARPEG